MRQCLDNIASLYYDTNMNWITTNIRFPEEMYMGLKLEAAKQRKSVASLIREKVQKKDSANTLASGNTLLKNLARVASDNATVMKSKHLSKLLIQMRYEQ